MTSQTSTLRRRAGASGVLAFVTMVIALGLALTGGLDEQALERGAVDLILSNMDANPTLLVVSMWGFVLLNVLIPIFGVDLYRILEDGRSGLLFAPIALIGAGGLFILESLLMIGITQGLAPAYAGATGAERAAIEATSLALFQFRNNTALLAGLFLAVAAFGFSRELLRSTDFPGWIGYWGYLVGVLGLIGAFYPLFQPLSFIRVLEQLLFILWVLIIGIVLLRRG